MLTKETALERIRELGLLAVIRGPSAETTLRMVDALVAGGVTGIEITYTTPEANLVVHALAERFGDDIVLGMGTLTQPEHARLAVDAGASFLVSPHCADNLAAAMVETNLLTMMGALTPTEIQWALNHGADVVKIFPASLAGPGYVKSLRGPYPDLPLMPTGGVSIDNLLEWFRTGVIAVGAGGALCPTAWARAGRFDEITARAHEFVHAVELARAES